MQAKIQKSSHEKCSIVVLLDHLRAADFSPLIDVFLEIDSSNIDAVDILHESPIILTEEYVLSMIRTINLKLRLVELRDVSFGKDFFRFVLWFPSIIFEKDMVVTSFMRQLWLYIYYLASVSC